MSYLSIEWSYLFVLWLAKTLDVANVELESTLSLTHARAHTQKERKLSEDTPVQNLSPVLVDIHCFNLFIALSLLLFFVQIIFCLQLTECNLIVGCEVPGMFQHVSQFLFSIKQYLGLLFSVIVLSRVKIWLVLISLVWCSTTVFSHSQTVVVCGNCQTVLCQPTGGRARLTEGCSFRKKGDWRRFSSVLGAPPSSPSS